MNKNLESNVLLLLRIHENDKKRHGWEKFFISSKGLFIEYAHKKAEEETIELV